MRAPGGRRRGVVGVSCVVSLWLTAAIPCISASGVVAFHPNGPSGRRGRGELHHAWTNQRIRVVADSLRPSLAKWREEAGPPRLSEEELRQALLWATYPNRVSSTHVVIYANKPHENLQLLTDTAPFPVTILSQEGKWVGTLDKLLGYWSYLQRVDDNAIVVFVDAFDVFGNGIDGHELLRRYFSFQRPIVLATEENVFPREVEAQAHIAVEAYVSLNSGNMTPPSRFVNAGGIIGMGWALKQMYEDMEQNMVARNPTLLQQHADMTGHWFLHAYDQYELWRFFIRHVLNAQETGAKLLLALDTEQEIFGSTVFRKGNWQGLLGEDVLGGVDGKHSIDVDVPLVFNAPQELFQIDKCSARFVGRPHRPVFWHGNGPWKPAWQGLRDRLAASGCFAPSTTKPLYEMCCKTPSPSPTPRKEPSGG